MDDDVEEDVERDGERGRLIPGVHGWLHWDGSRRGLYRTVCMAEPRKKRTGRPRGREASVNIAADVRLD